MFKRPKQCLLCISLVMVALSLFSCSEKTQLTNPPDEKFNEEVADTLVFDNAQVVYYGDDVEAGSDLWMFSFYTSMQIDDLGNPIGPGDILRITLNSPKSESQKPTLSLLDGRYTWQTNSSDFNPFTFIWGYMERLDLPTGAIYQNAGTFYGHLQEGAIEYEADLLSEGFFNMKYKGDSIISLEGMLIGKMCQIRYVKFENKINFINRATEVVPNSTLESDIKLTNFTKARIENQGDNFYLNDSSYRTFILTLGEANTDLSLLTPSGSGDVMQLSFFVNWETNVENGIPAGTYTMTTLTESNSLNRENIIPFNMNPGYPNRFTYPTGTWYFGYENDVMKKYACIHSGTMTVVRDGAGHSISFDLIDLSDGNHHVRGQYTTTSPIPIFDRYH